MQVMGTGKNHFFADSLNHDNLWTMQPNIKIWNFLNAEIFQISLSHIGITKWKSSKTFWGKPFPEILKNTGASYLMLVHLYFIFLARETDIFQDNDFVFILDICGFIGSKCRLMGSPIWSICTLCSGTLCSITSTLPWRFNDFSSYALFNQLWSFKFGVTKCNRLLQKVKCLGSLFPNKYFQLWFMWKVTIVKIESP